MTDNDLIRKSDALVAAHEADSLELQLHGASKIADRIAALPAVTVGVEWRNIETAPRGGEWFIARTEHGTTRVVRYADEYDRFPISHDGVVWPTAPTEWTPLKPVLAALEPVTAPDLTDPATVHANMLRGTIAKPTVEQIVHLYGVDALAKALAPVIVRDAAPYMTDLMVDPEEIPDMEMEYDHRAGASDDE